MTFTQSRIGPGGLLRSLVHNRRLAWQSARHEIKGRYKGTVLGLLWAGIRPLFQVAVYVVVITFVFNVRSSRYPGTFDYALYVLAGMVPWLVLSIVLQEAPTLIRNRMDLVKQVVFPIETLPLTNFLVHGATLVVGFALYVALGLIDLSVSWTVLLLPVPVFLLALMLIGVSWFLMIAGVVFKDLENIVAVIFSFLIFFSPVLLTVDMVGETIWGLMMFNPFSHVILSFRDVLAGTFHPWSWAIFASITVASLAIGGWVLGRTKLLINEYL